MISHLNAPSDRPVVDEFLRQVREEAYRLNLTSLWVVAGQPDDMEPGHWAKLSRQAGAKKTKVLRRPGGPAEADGLTAALFALELDESIEKHYYRRYRKRYKGRNNAIQAMIDDPTPLMAMLAVCDVMYMHGGGPWNASQLILGALVQWVQDLDAIEQETVIARAQRALRNESHPPTRSELYGHQEITA